MSTPTDPTPMVDLECTVPTFAPLAETEELQEKGGIQVSVTPVAHRCERDVVVSRNEATPSMAEHLQGMLVVGEEGTPTRFIEERRTPVLRVQPERMQLKIKLNNKLPRVFRGAGTVVQYIVAGKASAVDQKLYGNLLTAIVPPRTEQELTIYGPPVADIPDGSTIGVFLYDVITSTDDAGNVLEKQNFEWFFTHQGQIQKDTAPVQVIRGWERTASR